MSIVAFFGGPYCRAEEVAKRVAQDLGYAYIAEEDILDEAAKQEGASKDGLARTLYGPPPLLRQSAADRSQDVAWIRAALAERLGADNVVYCGFAMHLIPREITHVLRVCVVADQDYKVKVAMEGEGAGEREARAAVKADGKRQLAWVGELCDSGPWDEGLYDMVISMLARSVAEAADLVVENARKEAVAATPSSRQAMGDFLVASRVYLSLAGKWPHVDVCCEDGTANLRINKHVLRLERLKKTLAEVAGAVPGVKSVRTSLGEKYEGPSIYRDVEFNLPPKVLLVDDEREYVDTLSERLQARDMDSRAVYNGEEALSEVEEEEPDVMVLDLKMPGINGMEVLRKVKRERPGVEVIVLTGHGSEKDRELAKELGAFAYLEKPVDIAELTETLQKAYQKIHGLQADEESEKSTE